jgi:hypothetical protein
MLSYFEIVMTKGRLYFGNFRRAFTADVVRELALLDSVPLRQEELPTQDWITKKIFTLESLLAVNGSGS